MIGRLIVAIIVLLTGACAGAQELEAETANAEQWLAARDACHETRFEYADDLLADLRRDDPEFALAWGYSALVDAMLFRDVEEHVRRAVTLAAAAPPAERLMAEALAAFAVDDLGLCEMRLLGFLAEYPDDRYARHMLGFTRIDQRRPAEGLAVLAKLRQTHPKFAPAANHLGYGLAALGRDEEALAAFEAFLAADPDNPSAHDSLADGLLALDRREEAVAHLERAVALEPRFAYAWAHLGDVLRDGGDLDAAVAAYEQALEAADLYGPGFAEDVERRILELE